MKKEFLEAGKIVGTHGVRGEVKIRPWADSAGFLLDFERVYIDGEPVELLGGRVHKEMLIARLQGVPDVNEAMRLKGKTIFISRHEANLPPGEFFIQDILGAEVLLENGKLIGKLKDVLELPGGNVYEVQGEREYLIPAVPPFVLKTDPEAGKITVRLIEGM